MWSKVRNRHLLPLDALLLTASPILAYAIRFEGLHWPQQDVHAAWLYAALSGPLKITILLAFGLYRHLWRHAGIAELKQLLLSAFASLIACSAIGAFILPATQLTVGRVPITVLCLDACFTVALLIGPRALMKVYVRGLSTQHLRGITSRLLIVGAGAAGELIVKEILRNPQLGLRPVGFVDDDPQKQHHRLCNLPVLGPIAEIREIAMMHRIDEIIIAAPSAPGTVVRQVLGAAMALKIPTRTIPRLYDIITGRISVSSLRDVEIQDLLRRAPVRTDLAAVRSLVQGRTVLVTGAGGSIGSELCRQIAQFMPARLVLLGHGENTIFEIQNEIRGRYPLLPLSPVITDVRNGGRIHQIMERFRPDAVFHAAAHKHVPLMEDNVAEAVTNNVLGTKNVVEAAGEAGATHFVLISTDKAVRPSSIMGATKRVAELIVQHAARHYHRRFVAVRFGNVLGSRGSVVPTFLRQIRNGGPVTVTDPEMRRYFMTIPEAVQLVLQACALGVEEEIFVLDMGKPVKVVDLAADLIHLSGLEVGADVEIAFTGIRPGEKLHEEMFFGEEHAVPTHHPKVLRARHVDLPCDVDIRINALIDAALSAHTDAELRRLLQSIIPDFRAPAGGTADVRAAGARVYREVELVRPAVRGDHAPDPHGANGVRVAAHLDGAANGLE